jgi:hypothetical protein
MLSVHLLKEIVMAKISSELEERLKSMPNRRVDLIIRTQSDVGPHLDWLAAEDIEVRFQYRLPPGAAISCAGADALKLLNQDWVKSIELDAPVHAM